MSETLDPRADLTMLDPDERATVRELRRADLAPGMTDREVEELARAASLEEREERVDQRLDDPDDRYDW